MSSAGKSPPPSTASDAPTHDSETVLPGLRAGIPVEQTSFKQPPSQDQPTVAHAISSAAALDLGLPPELANHARYGIVERLGSGGMGDVYLAVHKVMGRTVALKIVNPAYVRNLEMVERFHREVQAAARLSHPNIVAAFDAEQAGATHFLCMEYVEGTDLSRLVRTQGPLSPAKACHYVRQAALGLQHAHERGMVHRDIKPHNLMLAAKNQIKILDFGLARFAREEENAGEGLTASGSYMGTAEYMAPEQGRDARSADIRADIYSLGCTLYFVLAGKVPFAGKSPIDTIMMHATEEVPPLDLRRPGLPPQLVAVVERMMAKKADERLQTPLEVAKTLESIQRTLTSTEKTEGVPESVNKTIIKQKSLTKTDRPKPNPETEVTALAVTPKPKIVPSEPVAKALPPKAALQKRKRVARRQPTWAHAVIGGVVIALVAIGGLAIKNRLAADPAADKSMQVAVVDPIDLAKNAATPGAPAIEVAPKPTTQHPVSEPLPAGADVKVETIREGSGAVAAVDDKVEFHVVGWFAVNGVEFRNTRRDYAPIQMRLGGAAFIRGWHTGLRGMKVGEMRRLTVPPDYGYGKEGKPPSIPPNATLVCELELLNVEKPAARSVAANPARDRIPGQPPPDNRPVAPPVSFRADGLIALGDALDKTPCLMHFDLTKPHGWFPATKIGGGEIADDPRGLRFHIKGGIWYWGGPNIPRDCAVFVRGKSFGNVRHQWGMNLLSELQDDKRKLGLLVMIDQFRYRTEVAYRIDSNDKEPTVDGPLPRLLPGAVVSGVGRPCDLLLLMRGRTIAVLVNGLAAGRIELLGSISGSHIHLCVNGNANIDTHIERMTVWKTSDIATEAVDAAFEAAATAKKR